MLCTSKHLKFSKKLQNMSDVEMSDLKSVGKSLTFRGAVYEAQDILRHHRCKDPICDTHLWKVKHELDMAKIRIRQLEKDLEAHGIKPTQTKYVSPSS